MDIKTEKYLWADSVLNRTVSGFKSAYDPKPNWDYRNDRPIWYNLGDILIEEPEPEVMELLQAIRNEPDADKRAELKTGIPSFTPSGFFTYRKASEMRSHTGLIAFDIDHKDNAGRLVNYEDLKKEVAKIPYVAYAGASVSGTGYWGLIRIEDPNAHTSHFKAIAEDFSAMGVIIDPAPANVASPRFYSYDPECYINHYPQVYTRKYIEPQRQKTQYRQAEPGNTPWHAFNATYNVLDMLEGYGWQVVGKDSAGYKLNRPGAKTRNKDAEYFPERNRVYVWTSSTPLPTNKLLSPFDVFLYYEAGGDPKQAVRLLKQTA